MIVNMDATRTEGAAAWVNLLTGKGDETGNAVAVLYDIEFRDGLIAYLCPGTMPLDLVDNEIRKVMEGLPPISEGAIERLVHFCASVPDEHAAPPLTMLANYTWFLGDGALTRMALERALRCDPTYRLAQLLERMVDLGIRPHLENR